MSRTHKSPDPNSGIMPCCGKTPFELPNEDRITSDPDLVTCAGGKAEVIARHWRIESHASDDDPGYWWYIGGVYTSREAAASFRAKMRKRTSPHECENFRLVRLEEIKTIEEED